MAGFFAVQNAFAWGAFAVTQDSTTQYVSEDHLTEALALADAERQCSAATTNCMNYMDNNTPYTFRDTCAAIVSRGSLGSVVWYVGTGASISEAIEAACGAASFSDQICTILQSVATAVCDSTPTPVSCTSPMIRDAATNTCKCPDDMPILDGGNCRACEGALIPNSANDDCVCPANMEQIGATDMCQFICTSPMIPNAANDGCQCPDTTDEINGKCLAKCEANEDRVGENCLTKCGDNEMRNPAGDCEMPVTVNPCGMNATRNQAGDCECDSGYTENDAGVCIMETTPPPACGQNEMRNPAGDCVCETGYAENDSGACVMETGGGATPPENVVYPKTGENAARETAAKVGAAVLVGAIFYNLVAPAGGDFTLTPDYAFSSNDGVAAYSYGSRLDYQNGNFSASWSSGRRHSGAKTGEWNYAAEAKYGRDFWKIGYGSRIYGETTELELSALLSEKTGVFGYSSGVIWDYHADKTDGDFSAFWRNSLTADYGNWRLMPSADFRWRDGGNILDGGKFRIDMRREF